jgi:molybdate transport system substrate-binding protein
VFLLLLLGVSVLLLGACGAGDGAGDGGSDGATTGATSAARVEGTVTVDAAQSLAKPFTELGEAFESAHPGTSVVFNFAGSASLVTQLLQGAPADVFASADEATMQRVVDAGLVDGAPRVFAENRLQIVVGAGNPKGVRSLADLARPGVSTVLCAANVPCGSYAREAIGKAGADVTPTSDETSVAGVLGRVQAGEADAGIVYVTDVRANDAVTGVAIPAAQNVVVRYPHAVLRDAPNATGARAFVAYVGSSAGQRVLAGYGFLPA